MLKETVSSSPIEKELFLSILQHLLCLRQDQNVRPAYYELIESSVSQIVLNESGEDPDFRSKQRFELNVESIVKDLTELRKLKEELGQTQVEENVIAIVSNLESIDINDFCVNIHIVNNTK